MKPLNEIRAVKQSKEDELLKLPGVNAVDIGPKIVDGKRTDELAIRVYVTKKKKRVPAEEKIPEEIDGVKTDVIEARFELHDTAAMPVSEIRLQADTNTYDPLVGGISIGPCGAVDGFVYTGTLGCMVEDRDSGQAMMLTNYHVIAEKWANGEDVCQPSRVDTGTCPGDIAGALVRSVISENVDGAVASIQGRGHDCSIHEIGDVKGKAAAAIDMAVRKRGRTTGLTFGTVDSINATVSVPYDDGDHILKNQIIIFVDEDQSAQFGNSGDSGSVVVNDDDKVVGLYFAGTPDGAIGVANPIDAVLDELNIDLCVDSGPKLLLEDKPWRSEIFKWWREDFWKDFLKEVAYDKPPFVERIDWGDDWRVNPPNWWGGIGGRGAGGRQAPAGPRRGRPRSRSQGEQPSVHPQATRCIDFGGLPVGSHPNPYRTGGATFEVFDYSGAPVANTRIVGWGGQPGLDVNFFTVVTHAPCSSVEVTLVHYATPPTVTGFDAAGGVVASVTMTAPQGTAETLRLGGGDIVRVEIDAPQNEAILHKYCHCARLKAPWKEKVEIKEFKEFKEWKEFKEKEKEFKEWKEFKEKEKELKEIKEKEIFEGFERVPQQPSRPAAPFSGGGHAASIEARLARLEALLGQSHFIGEQLRPDLSRGSLQNEPGYGR